MITPNWIESGEGARGLVFLHGVSGGAAGALHQRQTGDERVGFDAAQAGEGREEGRHSCEILRRSS